MKQRRTPKIVLIVGLLLFVVAVIGFFKAYTSARDTEAVVVAAKTIPANSTITAGDLSYEQVPKASVGLNDLTEADYKASYLSKKIPLVVTTEELQGQRLDTRQVAKSVQSSLAVVDSDERVIAVTASIPGGIDGNLKAGDVVDATETAGTSSGGATTDYAKVLCVSTQQSSCSGLVPGYTVPASSSSSNSNATSSTGAVLVVLAVAETDAPTFAGQAVTLDLNTQCQVNGGQDQSVPVGAFITTGTAACKAAKEDPSRIAAQESASATSGR